MKIRALEPHEISFHRQLRLRVLNDAPDSFAETAAEAEARPLSYWEELTRSVTEPNRHVMFVAFEGDVILAQRTGLSIMKVAMRAGSAECGSRRHSGDAALGARSWRQCWPGRAGGASSALAFGHRRQRLRPLRSTPAQVSRKPGARARCRPTRPSGSSKCSWRYEKMSNRTTGTTRC